jgi:arsenite/tail-anchored protein-transporting ATPase
MCVLSFLADPPRHLFFTGKGGVGKTSLACAAAIHLARTGKSVLLVSTDPASNVGQVFGVTIGDTVTSIPEVPGLWALEIDPEQAAQGYRDRIVGPVRGILPEADVRAIEEQLSGACTTEIASFNEFTDLLTDASRTSGFDHVIFDTAPTGHTIRLLQLPGAWTGFLDEGKGDASCLGPLAGLDKQRATYAAAVEALADPASTRMVLVARAQRSSIDEVAKTHTDLSRLGMTHQHLVVNGVLPAAAADGDPLAEAISRREQQALALLPAELGALPLDIVELKGGNMVGVPALLGLFSRRTPPTTAVPLSTEANGVTGLGALVDEIATTGHGLVMVMGKGGVGKTTVAAAVAVALADRGFAVHLTSTDPAAHLTDTLATGLDNLAVSRIDPAVETQRYRDQVLATKGAQLDSHGRAMLEEDLQSPCTEEIAVFQAFSRVIREARTRFVVVDTAPTGHTLLLLDATGSYDREVRRKALPGLSVTTPLMRLQDPDQTKVILVTLPETTPVLEAAELQRDLHRAGITPWAWVVNNSLAAAAPRSALLRQRAANELPEIDKVRGACSRRFALVPALAVEPVGIAALRSLAGSNSDQLDRNTDGADPKACPARERDAVQL